MHKKTLLTVLVVTILLTVLLIACCICLVNYNIKSNTSYKTSYKVEYIVNNSTYSTGSIENGKITNKPNDPETQGYIFDGWYFDNEIWKRPFSAQACLNLSPPSNNTFTIYAKFIKYTCELDNKSHSYTVIEEINATCISVGQVIEQCDDCGHRETTYLAPLKHAYSIETTKPAKCEIEGVITYSCTRENCNFSYTQSIAALQHTYISKITKPAKCEVEGVITYSCTRENCKSSYTQPIEALQHNFKSQITTQPTCSDKGVRTITCIKSDCNYLRTESIDELQHIIESKVIVKPCVNNGLKEHTCTRENCDYSYTEKIAALGYHDCDKNGNCIRCSAKNACSKNFMFNYEGFLVYNGNEVDVIVPSMFNGTVIENLTYTFSNNQTIKSVYIPDTVTILFATFGACLNLVNVRMPTNLQHIGISTFTGTKISSIFIPKTVEMIWQSAFSMCNYLKEIYYGGTEVEWEGISIDSQNNVLFSANITYNYIKEN